MKPVLNTLYRQLAKPVLFRMDAEKAHHFAMGCLKFLSNNSPLLALLTKEHDPRLEREVFGLKFPNPVGLAAGFDKNAEVLPAWAALGFGFVEAGTITALEQSGNPQPRLFRYPEQQALINRMGFNNKGSQVISENLNELKKTTRWPKIPIGINIGKSKVTPLEEAAQDYTASFQRLFPVADYFVINVSSPNTQGLRSLQGKNELSEILKSVTDANKNMPVSKPVLVKIAPDLELSQVDDVLSLAMEWNLAGLVVTNTTLDHSSIAADKEETGGLSGAPLREKSTEILRHVTKNLKLPVIASGGVMNADAAMEKFDAGAALVQVYTGYVYQGPALVDAILRAVLEGQPPA